MLYDGQICLITGERADHGNAFPSSPPLFHLLLLNVFFFFLGTKTAFLSYSFYYDFHLNSSFYRKTLILSTFPLNVPMARCLETHVPYIFGWWGGTKSDTSDEPSSKAKKNTPTIDDQKCPLYVEPAALAMSSSQTHRLIQNNLISFQNFGQNRNPPSRRIAREGKRKQAFVIVWFVVVRGLLGPLMA
jgi:hypothetical protein